MSEGLELRRQQVVYDKKWRKFLSRVWVLRFTPFVDFALAAGSLASGNVHNDSDFDVIIAARNGKIFTARFFCALFFGILGWRRKRLDHKESAANKLCLNHFVTEKSYRLSPPHNEYWKKLYLNLAPIFGLPEKIRQFWAANADWLGEIPRISDDLRYEYKNSAKFKTVLERALSGGVGNWLEVKLKQLQISRIERGLRSQLGHQPRIIYNDDELEFHPDTKRIDDYLKGGLR